MALPALALMAGPLATTATPANAASASHHVSKLPSPHSGVPALGADFGPDEIVNLHSNLCLGILGNMNYQPAVQWTCNGNADQQWHWGATNPEDSDYRQLINDNGSCLGVIGGSPNEGAQVVGWKCLGPSHYDQYWAIGPDAPCYGVVYTNLNTHYDLGVAGDAITPGASVVQWPGQHQCNNQRWSLPIT
jgi:hypothetical protein